MKKILFIIIFSISLQILAQEDAWVFLADKPNATIFLENPLTMLSQRALNRRTRQSIALDKKDVPIESTYYLQIKKAKGITVLAKSKWLNAIHIQGTLADINTLKQKFSFVNNIEFANKSLNIFDKKLKTVVRLTKYHQKKFTETTTNFNYGNAFNQITMLHGDFLHQQGYTGKGMQIAIIDAGFPNVNTNPAFQRLRENNQILGGYDFVHRNLNFYTGNSHGTHVLSDIGGYLENRFVGTAPDAKFYLFISEDSSKEAPIEESLWVEAAEKADSLGVDVINTSLGYTTFDKASYNYTYADMNGKTTFISRGAEIGASRGIILVNAAGNSGRNSWHYIGAPADARGVLSVGAVDTSSRIASFSSRGPTSDNRIKPDIMAQGRNAFVINFQSGAPNTSNGTSFSSPIIAGVVACFWQAYPNKTANEIKNAIRSSANRFKNPDNNYGYGIPNFEIAYNNLSLDEFLSVGLLVNVYPNPIKNSINLNYLRGDLATYEVTIYSVLGKKVFQQKSLRTKKIDISSFSKGVYLLQIRKRGKQKILKLIKN